MKDTILKQIIFLKGVNRSNTQKIKSREAIIDVLNDILDGKAPESYPAPEQLKNSKLREYFKKGISINDIKSERLNQEYFLGRLKMERQKLGEIIRATRLTIIKNTQGDYNV